MNFICLSIIYVFLIINLNLKCDAQEIDLDFCDPNKIPAEQPQIAFNLFTYIKKYQMTIEGNNNKTNETIELNEFYDGDKNIAVTRLVKPKMRYDIYTYGYLNEAYIIIENNCVVVPSNESEIPIISDASLNIISPLLTLFNLEDPSIKIVYTGKSVVRGINVNQWQTCVYDKKLKITKKIKYSLSDPKAWLPALQANNLSTIPVEVISENKKDNEIWTDVYSIVRFRSELFVDDDFWITPSGIYCQYRDKGKSPPKMPNSFKLSGQVITNNLLAQTSQTNNFKEIYNYNEKLIRRDYVENNLHYTQIDDYNTGVQYKIEQTHGGCEISKLGNDDIEAVSENNFIIMKNRSVLFDFDSLDIQYVGQRRINQIKSDIWIGWIISGLVVTTYEWYFESNYTDKMSYQKPVALIITLFNDKVEDKIYYYFNDYDTSGIDLLDFDLSICSHYVESKRFMFTIDTSKNKDVMIGNQIFLKYGVLYSIMLNCLISPVRVINLEVVFNNNNNKTIVAFSMLDKSPIQGAVLNPDEVSLQVATKRLEEAINEIKFMIPLVVNPTSFLEIYPDKDSFVEISRVKPTIVNNSKSSGYSSGTFATITIIFCIIGIIIGILIGVFRNVLIEKFRQLKNKTSNQNSMKNPSFTNNDL